jgi:BirA family biotin operon repressor/biotin-[acetyl-CoA-carboxylase] ligase
MKFIVHRLSSCPSTNDVARELALRGAAEGTVVLAGEQTAGRGTKNRSWFSPRGKGLYVSLVLRPAGGTISLMPIAAGIAAAEALRREALLEVRVRWPNDIVWQGKKLGGILCESAFLGNRPDYVILGFGLNVNHLEEDFPEELRPTAVSLRMIRGREWAPEPILQRLLPAAARWARRVARGEEKTILESFERRSAFRRGDSIRVRSNGAVFEGKYSGLDVTGALVLKGPSGTRRFTGADVEGLV